MTVSAGVCEGPCDTRTPRSHGARSQVSLHKCDCSQTDLVKESDVPSPGGVKESDGRSPGGRRVSASDTRLGRPAAAAAAQAPSSNITKCVCQICKCGNHFCGLHSTRRRYVKPEGRIDGSTEYKDKYVPLLAERVKSKKPVLAYLHSHQPLDGHTTYKRDYNPKHADKTKSCKLPEVYTHPKSPLDGNTCYKTDYVGKMAAPPSSCKPHMKYSRPDVAMEGRSVYKSVYGDPGISHRSQQWRPVGNDMGLHGPFSGSSTYKSDYDSKPMVSVGAVRPKDRSVGGGAMTFSTEYKDTYVVAPQPWCPAMLVKPVFVEEKTPWKPDYNLGVHTYFSADEKACGLTRSQMSLHNINSDFTPWKQSESKPRVRHTALPQPL